jgi:NDP-sugar pyrophosphorylase family protein
MKAMIFAAGLGTRLKPLTDTMPKAMVPIAGKPLLEHTIERIKSVEIKHIIINVHHFADQIIDFLNSKNNFDIHIDISDERDELLETGGGIKKATNFLAGNESILIHNVDILSNADLNQLIKTHNDSRADATLLVNKRNSSRHLLFDKKQQLIGWENTNTGETKSAYENFDPQNYQPFSFAGIHIISPTILKAMQNEKWKGKFSIIDFYLQSAKEMTILGHQDPELQLLDVGKLDSLEKAELFV